MLTDLVVLVIAKGDQSEMRRFCEDSNLMLVMSATLDSRVSLVLFHLQAAQSISAIQNVSRVLVFISLQNLSRLLVSFCHVFS